ncbi:hypothetical protein ACQKC8_12390 [Stutzerimonas stutzeri]|uniref:hypothetical protein n=1 Tax=Stutzerimonas stutzeri TaxID=316 RepID=UPI0005EBEB0C|nr:hypothetical protein [Stutzerimonas stutzeri]
MLACPKCLNTGSRLHSYRGTNRRLCCTGCGHIYNEKRGIDMPELEGKAETYVITAAVNATKAHSAFLKTLQLYCSLRGARLIVIPMRYKNPTRRDEVADDDWWDARLMPYITHERTKIANGLVVLADIKIQPTAVKPLQGWLTVSGRDSAILGHTKIALESVATRMGDPAKLVLTTGACTVEQYSDTNAGKKGEFHHTLGAVVVEVDGPRNHIRHICPMKDGSFIDLDTKYTVKGPEKAPRAEVLTMGDIHAEMADPGVTEATRALAALIQPKHLVLHDVLNFGSASHHSKFFEKFKRHVEGTSSVLHELKKTARHVDDLASFADQTIMVNSNHHDHFTQWLEKAENANDLENAIVFHETKAVMLKAIADGDYCDPFRYWMDCLMERGDRLKWLRPDESFMRFGIDFSNHGHRGPNGARGSTQAFATVGAKVTHGHGHGARIIDGAHSVGTSSQMNMGYNAGSLSSWTHSHDITYANGKRTLIHCVGGTFFRRDAAAARGAAA